MKIVNKKTNKDYCRAYRQKKGNLYKANDAARKKTERERRKFLEPKKYEVFKKKEAARATEHRLNKRCLNNYRSTLQRQPQKTTPTTSSAFSAKQILSRSVHKTERIE